MEKDLKDSIKKFISFISIIFVITMIVSCSFESDSDSNDISIAEKFFGTLIF